MPEKDRAADIGNMHKQLVKIARLVPEISSRTERQTYKTDTQTDILITILRNRSRGRSNEMLRRNGPVIKSVESVLRPEESEWC